MGTEPSAAVPGLDPRGGAIGGKRARNGGEFKKQKLCAETKHEWRTSTASTRRSCATGESELERERGRERERWVKGGEFSGDRVDPGPGSRLVLSLGLAFSRTYQFVREGH
ncbi:hypothetical protein ACJRO7_010255 [Eucalyptus globulus]|uniref:Uncharacterized protein n=1 Tax=Eucalyptus globulus TaxID=34317 RepID=A0ABD3LF23_EUCGL